MMAINPRPFRVQSTLIYQQSKRWQKKNRSAKQNEKGTERKKIETEGERN